METGALFEDTPAHTLKNANPFPNVDGNAENGTNAGTFNWNGNATSNPNSNLSTQIYVKKQFRISVPYRKGEH